jgi:hypothetical protein
MVEDVASGFLAAFHGLGVQFGNLQKSFQCCG